MGSSTQFLHNLSSFLYTTSSGWRLHCSRKSMSVWRPCSFRQKTSGEFRPEGTRGLSGLGDLVPLTKQRVRRRVRLGTRALALSASCGFLPLSPLTRCTRMCICTTSCRPYYPRDSQLAQRLQVNQTMGKQVLRLFRGCRRWRAARLDHLRHQDALSKGRILRIKQSGRSCVCNFALKTLQWRRSVLWREVMQ